MARIGDTQGGGVVRIGLLAWSLATLLVVVPGATPYATPASALQVHGALQRGSGVCISSHRSGAAQAP